ncbi:hypothetical protein CJ030_MR5G023751 [Morella rubra]|uniref:Uncharacterized protein n=1 Tax=Morella rubra TaxID=262757 RepID=A0A6A1VGQ9_9ROSI|nr:hypothetical protein CJ030_MR5G023751 [Morella rubra]
MHTEKVHEPHLQDVDNLKRACKEEATIKELTTLLQSSDVAGLKMHLTRLRRSSFPASNSSKTNSGICPQMANNLLYDLDSTTSPSSSDSDCSPVDQPVFGALLIEVLTSPWPYVGMNAVYLEREYLKIFLRFGYEGKRVRVTSRLRKFDYKCRDGFNLALEIKGFGLYYAISVASPATIGAVVT